MNEWNLHLPGDCINKFINITTLMISPLLLFRFHLGNRRAHPTTRTGRHHFLKPASKPALQHSRYQRTWQPLQRSRLLRASLILLTRRPFLLPSLVRNSKFMTMASALPSLFPRLQLPSPNHHLRLPWHHLQQLRGNLIQVKQAFHRSVSVPKTAIGLFSHLAPTSALLTLTQQHQILSLEMKRRALYHSSQLAGMQFVTEYY